MKTARIIAGLLLLLMLCACGRETPSSGAASDDSLSPGYAAEETESYSLTGTCRVFVEGFDWGPGVTRAVISFDQKIDSVEDTDFSVTEVKTATDYTQDETPAAAQTFERTVTAAFLSDEDGSPVEGPSNYVALDLYASPSEGSPINYDPNTGLNTWCETYALNIRKDPSASITAEGRQIARVDIDTRISSMTTSVDSVKTDSFTASDRVTYQYAHYEPDGGSRTLVVWLHGGGEGGTQNTDPRIPLLACRSAALMEDEFQDAVGGANILIPQCPTLWMDMNGGGRTADILSANDGTSFYTYSLKELIEFYREETGSEKIILAGCSNGGFMSLVLALSDPQAYDMIIPICETLRDETVTDSQLEGIAGLPVYFVYSRDDTVAVPEINSEPAISRLERLGAGNIHVSTSDTVTGTIETVSGQEETYQYMGHWSWIYFFKNETKCGLHGESAWEVIAETAGS